MWYVSAGASVEYLSVCVRGCVCSLCECWVYVFV